MLGSERKCVGVWQSGVRGPLCWRHTVLPDTLPLAVVLALEVLKTWSSGPYPTYGPPTLLLLCWHKQVTHQINSKGNSWAQSLSACKEKSGKRSWWRPSIKRAAGRVKGHSQLWLNLKQAALECGGNRNNAQKWTGAQREGPESRSIPACIVYTEFVLIICQQTEGKILIAIIVC